VKRGDVVIVATRGAYTGKPRTALVIQSDLFNDTHTSITVCPVTTDVIDAPLFRVTVPPGQRTGLMTASQIMVDKIVSVPRSSIAKRIGRCDDAELELVEDALRRWLAL
jgi:mRNA interferase MazF